MNDVHDLALIELGVMNIACKACSPSKIIDEMLGDMLLESKHPEEAMVEYEATLKTNPGRFDALYGAAQAAEQAGKHDIVHDIGDRSPGLDHHECFAVILGRDNRHPQFQRGVEFEGLFDVGGTGRRDDRLALEVFD